MNARQAAKIRKRATGHNHPQLFKQSNLLPFTDLSLNPDHSFKDTHCPAFPRHSLNKPRLAHFNHYQTQAILKTAWTWPGWASRKVENCVSAGGKSSVIIIEKIRIIPTPFPYINSSDGFVVDRIGSWHCHAPTFTQRATRGSVALLYAPDANYSSTGQASPWVVTQGNGPPLSPGDRQAAPFFNASATHPPVGQPVALPARVKKMWEQHTRTPKLLLRLF